MKTLTVNKKLSDNRITVRLSEIEISYLQSLMDLWEITPQEVIRRCIIEMDKRYSGRIPGMIKNMTDEEQKRMLVDVCYKTFYKTIGFTLDHPMTLSEFRQAVAAVYESMSLLIESMIESREMKNEFEKEEKK